MFQYQKLLILFQERNCIKYIENITVNTNGDFTHKRFKVTRKCSMKKETTGIDDFSEGIPLKILIHSKNHSNLIC